MRVLAAAILIGVMGVGVKAQAAEMKEGVAELGIFAGSDKKDIPENYFLYNTVEKMEKYHSKLEVVPKETFKVNMEGIPSNCKSIVGHDLESGQKVVDYRCWSN